jgi:hypothetical protein
MTATTVQKPPSIVERAQSALEEVRVRSIERERESLQRQREARRLLIVGHLMHAFGEEAEQIIERPVDDGSSDIAVLQGESFQMRNDRWGEMTLHVRCTCTECGEALWVTLGRSVQATLRELGAVLEMGPNDLTHERETGWFCLQQHDDEGEPTTDKQGNPLPVRIKPAPPPAPGEFFADFERATESLATAFAREHETQSLKGLRKAEAIGRIIGTTDPLTQRPHSASSAEKVVEQDPEYFAFLAECRAAIVDRIRREGDYQGCLLRAQLSIRLASPQEN